MAKEYKVSLSRLLTVLVFPIVITAFTVAMLVPKAKDKNHPVHTYYINCTFANINHVINDGTMVRNTLGYTFTDSKNPNMIIYYPLGCIVLEEIKLPEETPGTLNSSGE